MNKRFGALKRRHVLIYLSLCLAACGGVEGDDLDKFMADAAKDMRAKVDPLPEVKPYVPLEYNADGQLNDPFKPRKAQSTKTTGVQPDFNRPKEPLEAYPLESLQYVGSLSKDNLQYALIKTPDNSIQQVSIGNYMGQNFGIVTEITESEVVLKEIVQDELSGDWAEQTSSVSLQE
jgi:type IV pilus assembly protein PilP